MTLENIDRTIYELLRLKTVNLGLLPDITAFTNHEEYNNAIKTLVSTTKYNQIIQIVGIGAENARDEKLPNRIIIDRKAIIQGDLGSYGVQEFTRNTIDPTTFTKSQRDATTYNIQYDIRCISNSAYYDRVLNDIVIQTFSNISYKSIIEGNDFGEDQVLITQIDSRNVTSTDYLESLYTYQVSDIYLLDLNILKSDVKQIIDFDGSIEPSIDLDILPEVDNNPEIDIQGF